MTHLIVGEPAPWFGTSTPSQSSFAFSSVAGRYVLLGFLPQDASQRAWALAALEVERGLFDDRHLASFIVIRDANTFASLNDGVGRRWFFDPDGEISRLYGALDDEGQEQPFWVLIDPSMRILHIAAIEGTARLVQRLRGLPKVDDHAGAPLNAPVLIVPRIFESEVCRRLVDHYEADGGAPSGVMREVNGRTVPVLDDFKSRRDANVTDDAFQRELRVRISRRLVPEIKKAFQFAATRIERYIVACYDASEGGYFRPHRDNTTAGTAHRRFAVSINLNAEDYEGGDLNAAAAGQLRPDQLRTAERARILISGLATVGIVGLVDEATGYQDERSRTALQDVFNAFLQKELAAWVKRIPDEFYRDIFRLRGWNWTGMKGGKRPQALAYYTVDLIYSRLLPEIMEELESRMPRTEAGRRKGKLHQLFSQDVGHPALAQHIYAILTVMRLADDEDWEGFMRMINRAHPKKTEKWLKELLAASSATDKTEPANDTTPPLLAYLQDLSRGEA